MPTLAHSTLNGRLRLPNSMLQFHAKSVKISMAARQMQRRKCSNSGQQQAAHTRPACEWHHLHLGCLA